MLCDNVHFSPSFPAWEIKQKLIFQQGEFVKRIVRNGDPQKGFQKVSGALLKSVLLKSLLLKSVLILLRAMEIFNFQKKERKKSNPGTLCFYCKWQGLDS